MRAFLVLFFLALSSCSDTTNVNKYEQLSRTAILIPEGCSDFVQDEAEKEGYSVELVEVVYSHPVNRNTPAVGILHYNYLDDAMSFTAHINKSCLPKYELSISKEKLQNTAFQHHIYFGVDPKWIYYKDGEIRILYDKNELKP